jgi:hypothetical protein
MRFSPWQHADPAGGVQVMAANSKARAVWENVDSINDNDALEINDGLQKCLLDILNVNWFAGRHRRRILIQFPMRYSDIRAAIQNAQTTRAAPKSGPL